MTNQFLPDVPKPASPFDNIAVALREIASIVARLEETALSMCGCPSDLSQKTKSLQDFDLVLQSLGDLAGLMEAMGNQPDAKTTPDRVTMIAQMRLAWLRDLVGGAAPRSDNDTSRVTIF